MKKLLALLLALLLVVSLVACDSKKNDDEDEKEEKTSASDEKKDDEKEEEKKEEKEEAEEEEEEEEEEVVEDAPYEEKLELYIAAQLFPISESDWESLYPAAMYELISEILPYDEYVTQAEEADAELMETYGEDYEVSYQVLEEIELTDDELAEILDTLEVMYNVDISAVEEMFSINVEITISGSIEEETEETTFFVFFMDGEWYVLD